MAAAFLNCLEFTRFLSKKNLTSYFFCVADPVAHFPLHLARQSQEQGLRGRLLETLCRSQPCVCGHDRRELPSR